MTPAQSDVDVAGMSDFETLLKLSSQEEWAAVQKAFRADHPGMCGGDMLAALRSKLTPQQQDEFAAALGGSTSSTPGL